MYVSYFMTFINLIFTSPAEWRDLKSIAKWRVYSFLILYISFSWVTLISQLPTLGLEVVTGGFLDLFHHSNQEHTVVKVPSSRVPIRRRSPVGSPAWKLQWGNGRTIIYQIWLAAQVWVSLEDLSSPQEYDVWEQRAECVCSSHTQGFQTTAREPFVGNKNIESVVTGIYRNY